MLLELQQAWTPFQQLKLHELLQALPALQLRWVLDCLRGHSLQPCWTPLGTPELPGGAQENEQPQLPQPVDILCAHLLLCKLAVSAGAYVDNVRSGMQYSDSRE